MTDALTALLAFAKEHPTPLAFADAIVDQAHGDWAGGGTGTTWCGLFVHRFGQMFVPGWAPAILGPTAWDVLADSGIVSTDWSKAPTGAIHHFREKGSTPRPGHVAVQIEGHGGRAAMATSATAGTTIVKGIILCTIPQYLAQKGGIVEYVGWGMDYAGARFNLTDPALSPLSLSMLALTPTNRNGSPMYLDYISIDGGTTGNFAILTTDNGSIMLTDQLVPNFTSVQLRDLFERRIVAVPNTEKFTQAQINAMNAVLRTIKGTVTVDAGASVAADVKAALADNFAALAKQDSADQAALLAAIGQVDENTLATFGLKRI